MAIWIKVESDFDPHHECSSCGSRALEKRVWVDETKEVLSKFCPHCGEMMLSEDD